MDGSFRRQLWSPGGGGGGQRAHLVIFEMRLSSRNFFLQNDTRMACGVIFFPLLFFCPADDEMADATDLNCGFSDFCALYLIKSSVVTR